MFVRYALLSLLLALGFSGLCQDNWEKKKDRDGVLVHTKHVEGSGLKAIKATTEFDCSLHTCAAVLKDIPHLVELFPDCEKAEKIAQSETEQVHYLHLNAPWPVSDRDATFQLKYNYDTQTKTLLVNADVITGHYPEQKGVVRLTKGVGTWTFVQLENGKVSLTYRFHGEPGGSIPTWLANSVVEENPFKMLQNFHHLVTLDRYQNKSFSFID